MTRRRRKIRSRTINLRRLSKRDREYARALCPPVEDAERPKIRLDCIQAQRPCPFVGCKHHLYLDVTEYGGIRLNFPNREVWEMKETCALDVADRGGHTCEEVGELINVSRERVRQIEFGALDVKKGWRR